MVRNLWTILICNLAIGQHSGSFGVGLSHKVEPFLEGAYTYNSPSGFGARPSITMYLQNGILDGKDTRGAHFTMQGLYRLNSFELGSGPAYVLISADRKQYNYFALRNSLRYSHKSFEVGITYQWGFDVYSRKLLEIAFYYVNPSKPP